MSTKTKQTHTAATDNGQQSGETLDRAVADAENMVQATESLLAAHDAEKTALAGESVGLLSTLDQATLAGDQRTMDEMAARLGALRERIASLDRVRGQREAAIQEALTRLFDARRDQARHRLTELGKALRERNRLTIEHLDAAARLQEENHLDRSVSQQLSREFGLDPVRCQLAVPRPLIRSKGLEHIRDRIDSVHAYGVTVTQPR